MASQIVLTAAVLFEGPQLVRNIHEETRIFVWKLSKNFCSIMFMNKTILYFYE